VSGAVVGSSRRALAALAAAYHGHPSRQVVTCGVTGTNGKSTTCSVLRSILRAAGHDAGLLGTLTYETGRRTLPARMTTPESPEIQQYLREMADAGLRHAVMEVSSHSLDLDRVAFVRFAVAIFTQLTPEHLDWHRTVWAYRESKAKLFAMLPPDGHAVLNLEDRSSRAFAQRTAARIWWYGLDPDADVHAEITGSGLTGMAFDLHTPSGTVPVRTRLVGEHNVRNAVAAAAGAHALGVPLEAIGQGIGDAETVNGRLDPVACGQRFAVLIDYAHTHDALRAVLSAVRPSVKGRILVVFGAGGDRDRTKRPKMGDVVSRLADLAWVTSDNPRSEDPLAIIAEIRAGASNPNTLCAEPDRRLAISAALSEANDDDLVLVTGKGHEREQVFRDGPVPFDDRDVVRNYFAQAAHV